MRSGQPWSRENIARSGQNWTALTRSDVVLRSDCTPTQFSSKVIRLVLLPTHEKVKASARNAGNEKLWQNYPAVANRLRDLSGPGCLVLVAAGIIEETPGASGEAGRRGGPRYRLHA